MAEQYRPSSIRVHLRLVVLAVAALGVAAGCGGSKGSSQSTAPASSVQPSAATVSWCSQVAKSAQEYTQGNALEQQGLSDQQTGNGPALTELINASAATKASIADAKTFIGDPPSSIAAAFQTATSIPSDTIIISQEQQLAAAKEQINSFVAKECNVNFDVNIWIGSH
jgi:hypothetical protein